MNSWSFLTNHARALLLVAKEPDTRLRDLAAVLDITEKAHRSQVPQADVRILWRRATTPGVVGARKLQLFTTNDCNLLLKKHCYYR